MGRCLITGLEAKEINLVLFTLPVIKVTAAFAGSDGALHGKTTKEGNWSEETLSSMSEFIKCVEKDMMEEHFDKDDTKGEEVEDEPNVPSFLGNIDEPQV